MTAAALLATTPPIASFDVAFFNDPVVPALATTASGEHHICPYVLLEDDFTFFAFGTRENRVVGCPPQPALWRPPAYNPTQAAGLSCRPVVSVQNPRFCYATYASGTLLSQSELVGGAETRCVDVSSAFGGNEISARAIAVSPSGEFLAVALGMPGMNADGLCLLHVDESGDIRHAARAGQPFSDRVAALRFSPCGRFIAVRFAAASAFAMQQQNRQAHVALFELQSTTTDGVVVLVPRIPVQVSNADVALVCWSHDARMLALVEQSVDAQAMATPLHMPTRTRIVIADAVTGEVLNATGRLLADTQVRSMAFVASSSLLVVAETQRGARSTIAVLAVGVAGMRHVLAPQRLFPTRLLHMFPAAIEVEPQGWVLTDDGLCVVSWDRSEHHLGVKTNVRVHRLADVIPQLQSH